MNEINVEIIHEQWKVNIQLTANPLREHETQMATVEDGSSIQITTQTAATQQSVAVTRTVMPVQETNKLASSEVVMPKLN